MSDPIADLLTRMNNARLAKKTQVEAPHSKFRVAILNVLKDAGFIDSFETRQTKNRKLLIINMKVDNFTHIKRLSKPGQRIYVNYKDIPRPLRGLGLIIISTPRGVITGNKARSMKLGGELICEVW